MALKSEEHHEIFPTLTRHESLLPPSMRVCKEAQAIIINDPWANDKMKLLKRKSVSVIR